MPEKQGFSQKDDGRQRRKGFLFWQRAPPEPPRDERFDTLTTSSIRGRARPTESPILPSPARFEKFTERARKVFSLAQEEAQRFNHNYIGTEHLLLGLLSEGDGIAARVLANLDVQLPKVRSAVEFIIGKGDGLVVGAPGLTPRAKKVIELAMDEARRLNSHYVGTEHLLLGLVCEGEGITAGVLQSMGVSLGKVRQQVLQVLAAASSYQQQAKTGEFPPTTIPPWSETRSMSGRGSVFASMSASGLVYGLTLPPETFTKLTVVAQQLHRPVDDLIREAIARTWLVEPPTDPTPSHEQAATTETDDPPQTGGETPATPPST